MDKSIDKSENNNSTLNNPISRESLNSTKNISNGQMYFCIYMILRMVRKNHFILAS